MYKITFNLKYPLCFTDRPIFDSILARCYLKNKHGYLLQKLMLDKVDNFEDLPLVKHGKGYYLASIMYFDGALNFTSSWKKRWANTHDFMAYFGRLKKKIAINRREFKSYDVPKNMYHIKNNKVWFYFESNNIEFVEKLIENHLIGIGKKVSQGDGWFDSFEITESNKSFEKELLRPIPVKLTKLEGTEKYCAWKLPYWLPENMELCKYPDI